MWPSHVYDASNTSVDEVDGGSVDAHQDEGGAQDVESDQADSDTEGDGSKDGDAEADGDDDTEGDGQGVESDQTDDRDLGLCHAQGSSPRDISHSSDDDSSDDESSDDDGDNDSSHNDKDSDDKGHDSDVVDETTIEEMMGGRNEDTGIASGGGGPLQKRLYSGEAVRMGQVAQSDDSNSDMELSTTDEDSDREPPKKRRMVGCKD